MANPPNRDRAPDATLVGLAGAALPRLAPPTVRAAPAGRPLRTFPLWGLARPREAGRWLAVLPAWRIALLLVAGLFGLTAVLTGLILWNETFRLDDLGTPPSPGVPLSLRFVYAQRDLVSVLAEWYADGVKSPPVVIAALVFFLGGPLLLVLALLNLPLVQRTEPVWSAVTRTLRLAQGVLLPMGWSVLLAGLAANVAAQLRVGTHSAWGTPVAYRDPAFLAFVFAAVGVWYLIVWLRRAAEGARGTGPDDLSPRCEGCGYDLTHQPADGRCSECGLALAASLEPATRPGPPWANGYTPRNWAVTTWRIITAPGAFYRDLRLRDPHEPEVTFAAWTYVGIGVGALAFEAVAALVAVFRHGAPPAGVLRFAVPMAVVMTAFGVAGCWVGHRANAALVGAIWLARAPLRDGRWVARIIGYESAYLWVFCTLWGALAVSFIVWEDWVTELLGRHPFGPRWFGFPPEPLLVLGSTFALLVLWWWRYRIAYRAVCWSNF